MFLFFSHSTYNLCTASYVNTRSNERTRFMAILCIFTRHPAKVEQVTVAGYYVRIRRKTDFRKAVAYSSVGPSRYIIYKI